MKKSLIVYFLICLAIFSTACVAPKPPAMEGEALSNFPVRDGHYIIEDEYLGISFGIPVTLFEEHTINYWPLSLNDCPPATPPLEGMQISFCPPGLLKEVALLMSSDTSEEMMQEVTRIFSLRSRLLYSIRFYSAEQWDSWLGSGKSMADITGYKENRELGRQNGRVYVYTEPAQSEQGLSEEELPSYRQAVAAIPAMHTYAVMLEVEQAPPVPAKSRNSLPDFSTQDIYGTALDSSIFADYDLTMLNIWGTFCGPCIMEMPYLGEMAAAMPAGTQMVGLVGDAIDQETIKMAQNIAEETGAIYPHIVPDKALGDFLNRNIQFFPTTLFIDNAGNIVGEPIIGAVSRSKYEEELNKRLDKINEQ